MVTRLQVKVKTFFKEMQEMTEITPEKPNNPGSNGRGQKRRSPLAIFLGVLVSIEAMLVSAGALYFLSRIFLETPDNLTGAIVIFGITLVMAVGLIATSIGTFRAQPWTRGAILTWQILQFAIATSFIQGIIEWQPVGWTLIALSFATCFLVVKQMLKPTD
ncbi:hypothetical protein [Aurantimicrobium photophilum]|uniref:Uncharacterized protein n=1 Tax=Aurantimicrobium photophilum TaxID=1987356 RepID=A0A2Z3RY38_9MICO|nr:hypothetical protein [Aurantimicrobium photophilum]AWR21034.1 hypothetical protein AURMO_00417 [Aurantimicrobium photophilum]